MDGFLEFISAHRAWAPLITFLLIFLAGANIPISIDVIIVAGAVLSATTFPEYAIHMYVSILLGCYFAAWLAYGIGRAVGGKLLQYKWFKKLFPDHRMEKINGFYHKHGLLTLLIGRFIPFGVRNGIFMSSGMSKSPFLKFALRDALACFIWTTVCFTTFYAVGLNFETLLGYVKTFNIAIFTAFGVTGIALFWYKRKKRTKTVRENDNVRK